MAFKGKGTFAELMTADYSFVDGNLANLYGQSASGGLAPPPKLIPNSVSAS
ncbi:MAG: hypothetical protein R3C68_03895 [Myxococcota bacterium]